MTLCLQRSFSPEMPFPLSLPKLDRYLSSLPPPYLGDESDTDKSTMFPPLDQLAKAKKSLEDLENNSVVAPTWRNPTSILNFAANLLISLLGTTISPPSVLVLKKNVIKGSSALASFYSLTGPHQHGSDLCFDTKYYWYVSEIPYMIRVLTVNFPVPASGMNLEDTCASFS